MAKLFTKHDPWNVHKILGFLCLFHYLYRFSHFALYGNLGFESDGAVFVVGCMCLHLFLSGTALLFRLPTKRIKFDRPMIWPEFRAHNILFAYRPILAVMIPKVLLATGLSELVPYVTTMLIIVTLLASKWISDYFESSDKTMRGMPYPKGTPELSKKEIKRFHAVSQFQATISTFVGMDYAFLTLMPVQVSAFLMTLVRKGLISSRDWHNLYAVTLVLPYIMLGRILAENVTLFPYFFFTTVGSRVRLNYNVDKFLVWGGVLGAAWIYRLTINPDQYQGEKSFPILSTLAMSLYGIILFRDLSRLVRNLGSMTHNEDCVEMDENEENAVVDVSVPKEKEATTASVLLRQTTSSRSIRSRSHGR